MGRSCGIFVLISQAAISTQLVQVLSKHLLDKIQRDRSLRYKIIVSLQPLKKKNNLLRSAFPSIVTSHPYVPLLAISTRAPETLAFKC